MALPAIIPFSMLPVETLRITNIRKKVRAISRTNDCIIAPEGIVRVKEIISGKRYRRSRLAAIAPRHWLMIY